MPRSAHRLKALRTWARSASLPLHCVNGLLFSKNAYLRVVPFTHLRPFITMRRTRSPPTSAENCRGGPSRSAQNRCAAGAAAFDAADGPRRVLMLPVLEVRLRARDTAIGTS